MVKIDLQFFDDRPPLAVYSSADIDGPPPGRDRAQPNNAIEFLSAEELVRHCNHPPLRVGPGGAGRQTHALLRRVEDALCNGQEHAS